MHSISFNIIPIKYLLFYIYESRAFQTTALGFRNSLTPVSSFRTKVSHDMFIVQKYFPSHVKTVSFHILIQLQSPVSRPYNKAL